jgi:hypothetical protein
MARVGESDTPRRAIPVGPVVKSVGPIFVLGRTFIVRNSQVGGPLKHRIDVRQPPRVDPGRRVGRTSLRAGLAGLARFPSLGGAGLYRGRAPRMILEPRGERLRIRACGDAVTIRSSIAIARMENDPAWKAGPVSVRQQIRRSAMG